MIKIKNLLRKPKELSIFYRVILLGIVLVVLVIDLFFLDELHDVLQLLLVSASFILIKPLKSGEHVMLGAVVFATLAIPASMVIGKINIASNLAIFVFYMLIFKTVQNMISEK